jgi:hypothetical protein
MKLARLGAQHGWARSIEAELDPGLVVAPQCVLNYYEYQIIDAAIALSR